MSRINQEEQKRKGYNNAHRVYKPDSKEAAIK